LLREELEKLRNNAKKTELKIKIYNKGPDRLNKIINSGINYYIDEQYEILRRTWELVDEAENTLLTLGFQVSHTRRLILYRLKNATTFIKIIEILVKIGKTEKASMLKSQAKKQLQLAGMALDALKATLPQEPHDNQFWHRTWAGQDAALKGLEDAEWGKRGIDF
jgi:sugar-specific transcriptional regulator TrmB